MERNCIIKIKYKLPREVSGQWLAENDVGGKWSDFYNPDQKEYWYKKSGHLNFVH